MPKATGTHGNSRPAPASARTHSRKVSTNDDQARKPDGANGPACVAPRGGQVPAMPWARCGAPSRSAMPLHLYDPLRVLRLPEAVISAMGIIYLTPHAPACSSAAAEGEQPEAGAPVTSFCPPHRERAEAHSIIQRELEHWDRKLFSASEVADWIVESLEAD